MIYDADRPHVARVEILVESADKLSREVFELDGRIVFRIGPRGGKQLLIRCDDPQWCYDAARALELGGDELRHAQLRNEGRKRS